MAFGAEPRTALVTGASSGLGRALSLRLAAGGMHVVLAARREALLASLADEIAGRGGRATVWPLDVSDGDAAAERIAALDRQQPLDLVIACAGVGPGSGPAWSWSHLRAPCHVNFCGAVATLTAAIDGMIARGGGHLVGISSLSRFGALPASAAYCSPKAGLSMLLDCLRLDLAPHGIAVTSVHAGFIDTPMVAHRTAAMPQLLSAERAADIVVDALGRRPAYIDFPQPLALGARLAGALPRALRDRIVGRLG